MNVVFNVLFWLVVMAVLLFGSYFLFFELGMLVTDSGSKARAMLRPAAIVLSVLLTPAALAVAVFLFGQRRT